MKLAPVRYLSPLLVSALMLFGVSGCGQKGPLKLEENQPNATPTQPPQAEAPVSSTKEPA